MRTTSTMPTSRRHLALVCTSSATTSTPSKEGEKEREREVEKEKERVKKETLSSTKEEYTTKGTKKKENQGCTTTPTAIQIATTTAKTAKAKGKNYWNNQWPNNNISSKNKGEGTTSLWRRTCNEVGLTADTCWWGTGNLRAASTNTVTSQPALPPPQQRFAINCQVSLEMPISHLPRDQLPVCNLKDSASLGPTLAHQGHLNPASQHRACCP